MGAREPQEDMLLPPDVVAAGIDSLGLGLGSTITVHMVTTLRSGRQSSAMLLFAVGAPVLSTPQGPVYTVYNQVTGADCFQAAFTSPTLLWDATSATHRQWFASDETSHAPNQEAPTTPSGEEPPAQSAPPSAPPPKVCRPPSPIAAAAMEVALSNRRDMWTASLIRRCVSDDRVHNWTIEKRRDRYFYAHACTGGRFLQHGPALRAAEHVDVNEVDSSDFEGLPSLPSHDSSDGEPAPATAPPLDSSDCSSPPPLVDSSAGE